MQLATVATDGTPRVRTLVFRGWSDDDAFDLLTDDRSAKPAELRQQPAVELCWLLPKACCSARPAAWLHGCCVQNGAVSRQHGVANAVCWIAEEIRWPLLLLGALQSWRARGREQHSNKKLRG